LMLSCHVCYRPSDNSYQRRPNDRVHEISRLQYNLRSFRPQLFAVLL
jgi:hypothetical protein